MGRIVVGYDFSAGSAKAVGLAVDIANRWRCDLRLVYVSERYEDEVPLREEIERRVSELAMGMKEGRMEYVVRQGSPAEELAAQAEADRAELLVVGTHGMSGLKTNLLGGNSYRTIERSAVPVLIVREDFDFNKDLERIVVPIDSSEETRQKVGEAAMFGRTFGSVLHVVGLYSSGAKETHRTVDTYVQNVERYLERMGVRFESRRREVERNVAADTLAYASEVGADMVVIMTEQERHLSNLLLGTYAQQIINQATMPVLTVRPKQVMTENSNY